MDRDDIIDLLTIVQASDNRSVGEPEINVWGQMLNHLDKNDCTDAIMAFRAEHPGMWLEPGHVFQRVKAATRDRLDRMDPDVRGAVAGPSGAKRDEFGFVDKSTESPMASLSSLKPVASEETRRAFFEEFARLRSAKFDDGVAEEVPSVQVLRVRCPFCKAPEGERCTMPGRPAGRYSTPDSKTPLKVTTMLAEKLTFTSAHPSRVEAAALKEGFSREVADVIVAAHQRRQVVQARSRWSAQDALVEGSSGTGTQLAPENGPGGVSGPVTGNPEEGSK